MTGPRRISWKSARCRFEALRLGLDRLLERASADGTRAAAIALTDGRPLALRAQDPVDLATLPHAAAMCGQYLRLKPREVAIVSEPFAGGSRLSNVAFVTVVEIGRPGRDASAGTLLVALRSKLPSRFSLDEKLDREGVRIPPTPLGRFGAINDAILGAIACHPLAPREFAPFAAETIGALERLAMGLQSASRDPLTEIRVDAFDDYLSDAARRFHERQSKLPLGRSLVSRVFESGETIKLAVDVREDKVSFDFAGSDSSVNFQLTDRATFGACFAAVCEAVGAPLEGNAGAFAAIEVRSVPGTMVNAKAPTGLGRGMTDLATAVTEIALEALAKNRASLRRASGSRSSTRWQFEFNDGRVFYDQAIGGSGASASACGKSAFEIDGRAAEFARSIEKTEQTYPVEFSGRALRPRSGGAGMTSGGDGAMISLRPLAPCKFVWSIRDSNRKASGLDGGKPGASADVAIARAGGKREPLASSGESRIEVGDCVYVRTAGGGGFGEKLAPAEDEDAE